MEYGLTKLLTCTWVFVWKKVCTVLFNPFSVSLQEQYVCKTVQCVFLIHKHNKKQLELLWLLYDVQVWNMTVLITAIIISCPYHQGNMRDESRIDTADDG